METIPIYVYKRRSAGKQNSADSLTRVSSGKKTETMDSESGRGNHEEPGETMDQGENEGGTSKKKDEPCKVYVRRRKKNNVISDSSDSTAALESLSTYTKTKSRTIDYAISPLRKEISDRLFGHCFEKIWSEVPQEKKEHFTQLNCLFFYMYTTDAFKDSVLTWIKDANIFSKTYVIVPIIMWSHWYILVLCNFGESLDSKTKTPCMFLLDSLHRLDPLRIESRIRRFVLDIFGMEGRRESSDEIAKIPLLVPKVPQQRNEEECGVYSLFFANLFLECAPETFSISDYPYFMKEDWFDEEAIEAFYDRLEQYVDGFVE